MNERLVFGCGTSGQSVAAPSRSALHTAEVDGVADAEPVAKQTRERRDWAFIGLMIFTGLLFFRPQDQVPALNPLHLAELSALLALGAMVSGRLSRGLSVTRVTPELIGVVTMGFLILATAPFSVDAANRARRRS